MNSCWRLLPLLTVVGALAAPTAAPAATTITEYSSGLTSAPRDITRGPDGNLWFTQDDGIGKITPAGAITEYNAGSTPGFTTGQVPSHITAGPDGALWFTEEGVSGQIARFDPVSETVSEYSQDITANRRPTGITLGPDGNLWFTERGGYKGDGAIGRITPDGDISEYTSGLASHSAPTDIAAGADGHLWFTEKADPGRIGRIDPDTFDIDEFSDDLTSESGPGNIVAASNGALYFTQASNSGRIGRVQTDGTIDEYASGLTAGSAARDIAEDGDGTLWLTATSPGRLGRISPASGHSAGATPELSADAVPAAITRGPGDDVWFTDEGPTPSIGRISDSAPPTGGSHVFVPAATPAAAFAPPPIQPAAGAAGLLPSGAPVLGQDVGVRPLSGSVRIRLPGARRFTPLAAGGRVPVGSLIDARRGRVVLRSALRHGRSQKGTFWGAIFQIRQRRLGRGMTDLILRGGRFGTCPTRATRAGASALAREAGGRRRVVRRLWGKDRHGRFRTHGRDSVATVRGTRWVTTDRCDGTLTRVRTGKVRVRDLRRHRSVLLTAGRAYLARHRQR